MHRPALWAPRSEQLQEIHDIGRHVDELKRAVVQEKNRLKSGIETVAVVEAIENHLGYLNDLIDNLEKRMRTIISSDERLRCAFACATSIIGVGETVACTFLGEIGFGDEFASARQVEVYCGLNPRLRTSGSSLNSKPKLSKMGSVRMRRALYMPALSAMQHNPVLRQFAERLREAGKHPRAIVGAIMRKLLRLLFAVVKARKNYDVEFHARPTNLKFASSPVD